MTVYNPISVDILTSTADALGRVVVDFTAAAAALQQHDIEEVWLPWSTATYRYLSMVNELGADLDKHVREQILAKKQGRPSRYEAVKEISAREMARRRERETIIVSGTTPLADLEMQPQVAKKKPAKTSAKSSELPSPVVKRGRGRPKGSKNKPKS